MRNARIKPVELRAISLIAALVVAVAGCGTGSGPPPAAAAKVGAAPSSEPAPRVEILSWDQAEKRRESFRGKVVVLDVWSTGCQPCIREFPQLVALQKHFGDAVACISFNTDYAGARDEPPESFRGPVLKFLTAQDAPLTNVICSDPSEEFFDRIHLGGPPAVFVYGRDGKLIKRFDNSKSPKTPEFTYRADIVPLVENLVAGAKSGR